MVIADSSSASGKASQKTGQTVNSRQTVFLQLNRLAERTSRGGCLVIGPVGLKKTELVINWAKEFFGPGRWFLIGQSDGSIGKAVADQIRTISLLQIEGRQGIIIDRAERLTPEAQNTLLKALEETASDTFFILVTSRPNRILATIRSRLPIIRCGRWPEEEVSVWLKEHPQRSQLESWQAYFPGQPGLMEAAVAETDGRQLCLRFAATTDTLEQLNLTEAISKQVSLDLLLTTLMQLERQNLITQPERALTSLKLLTSYLPFLSYPVNQQIQNRDVCLRYQALRTTLN